MQQIARSTAVDRKCANENILNGKERKVSDVKISEEKEPFVALARRSGGWRKHRWILAVRKHVLSLW